MKRCEKVSLSLSLSLAAHPNALARRVARVLRVFLLRRVLGGMLFSVDAVFQCALT